jgi:hypothetical protein
MARRISIFVAIASLLLSRIGAFAETREQVLFEVPASGYWRQLILDQNAQGIGYAFEERTGEQKLFLNGKWVTGYDSIPDDGVVATPDGKHVAFVGIRGGSEYAVIDGNEGPPFHRILSPGTGFSDHLFPHYGAIRLSQDGKHYLYEAFDGRDDADARQKIILDGKVVADPGSDIGRIAITDDWNHWAYAKRDTLPGYMEWTLVIDGKERRDVPNIWGDGITFSKDGKRAAYTGWQDGISAIIDGDNVKSTGVRGEVVFTPDGKGFAILSRPTDDTMAVVIDGVTGPRYKKIVSLIFSPDGKRVAYEGYDGQKSFAVCDGRAGPAFDDVEALGFSPKGDPFFYQGRTYLEKHPGTGSPSKLELILRDANGVEKTLPGETVQFSPDGKHLACIAPVEAHFITNPAMVNVFVDDTLVATVEGEQVQPLRFLDNGHLVLIVEQHGERLLREEIIPDGEQGK